MDGIDRLINESWAASLRSLSVDLRKSAEMKRSLRAPESRVGGSAAQVDLLDPLVVE